MQLLLSVEQRRRLEAAARSRGATMSELVRDAIDERYGSERADRRQAALAGFRAAEAEFVPPEELGRLVDERFDG